MIECNNCEVEFTLIEPRGCDITLRLPAPYFDAVNVFKDVLDKKRINQVYVKMGPPRKPRTDKQRGKFHAICREISQHTGEDFASTKWQIKMRAIKRGYPITTGKLGEALPQSEAECSTVEENMLIDECHEVASWLGVKLKEM